MKSIDSYLFHRQLQRLLCDDRFDLNPTLKNKIYKDLFKEMRTYHIFLLLLVLGVAVSKDLKCSTTTRATKGGIHYPGSMNMKCPAATAAAEGTLTSYHYRKACQDAFGLSSVPASVSDVRVIDCFEAPAPGWKDGTVVEVEVCCKFDKWTKWLDRDNPSGDGDWQDITNFLAINQACANPNAIECRLISNQVDANLGGETIVCNTNTGFYCRNIQQADKRCQDYEVRFACP